MQIEAKHASTKRLKKQCDFQYFLQNFLPCVNEHALMTNTINQTVK